LGDDEAAKFGVVNFEDYKKSMNSYFNERKIFLITKPEPCVPPR